MANKIRHIIPLLVCCTIAAGASSQQKDNYSYVNPFIGTTKANVLTKWGSEGGTYPGAVAPWGAVQLTPETRPGKGYDHADSSIYFFSCVQHWSGFPNGSSGNLCVMPVQSSGTFRLNNYSRRFSHTDEKAEPGYYSVLFRDNHTLVEATALEHTGFFRFTFAPHVIPAVFIGNAGKITTVSKNRLTGTGFNSLFHFNKYFVNRQDVDGGCILQFTPAASGATIIELSIATSTVNTAGAEKNMLEELTGEPFDDVMLATRHKWQQVLSVIDIDDANENNKTIFYTALYHALLVPWIISDVNGQYRGRDGQVHKASGKHAYNAFSTWDTFRTLHPLLCLLYPDRQKDMVKSMLDIYRQTGYLPVESMTGNHAIPVIADAWLKGITGYDSGLVYKAMKKSIDNGPFIQPDMQTYQQLGYIPFTYPESVTRTVEYAYDDWALGQFAEHVMHDNATADRFRQRSFNYRNLFNAQELFLLPRNKGEYKLHPGTFGYKEGDAWVYSYFVPHNGKDLVNIMGGNLAFTKRLDEALAGNQLIFDNETMFHVPYLFNYTNAPYKTQEWVQSIMRTRFSATPGGIPGNDDLGSMSSWFIFSAMGIYPVCPGRPVYTISSPLFRSLTLQLPSGKNWTIQTNADNRYIKSLSVNGQTYNRLWISHSDIVQGGQMNYMLGDVPSTTWVSDTTLETEQEPHFELINFSLSKNKMAPNELVWAHFTIQNKGAAGTKKIQVMMNGMRPVRDAISVTAAKNCFVPSSATITDSIAFRVYPFGKATLQINESPSINIEVIRPNTTVTAAPVISNLVLQPVLKKGSQQTISYTVQNIDGETHTFYIPLKINDSLYYTDTATLEPGVVQRLTRTIPFNRNGMYSVHLNNTSEKFKVYSDNLQTTLLDLRLPFTNDTLLSDSSGFHHHAQIIRSKQIEKTNRLPLGTHCFVEVPNALSLDSMGETITMMAWVFTSKSSNGLTDLLTKGDHHVLQLIGQKQLNFFAGGWGRGECTVDLPANWLNNWHHITGVCDGKNLRVYIDGMLKGTTPLQSRSNLSAPNKWTIGRNEEFPGERIFEGCMDKVKIFAAALTGKEIEELMKKEKGQ